MNEPLHAAVFAVPAVGTMVGPGCVPPDVEPRPNHRAGGPRRGEGGGGEGGGAEGGCEGGGGEGGGGEGGGREGGGGEGGGGGGAMGGYGERVIGQCCAVQNQSYRNDGLLVTVDCARCP